jgi:hypothetical protein
LAIKSPRGFFGDGFGFHVSANVIAVWVGPVFFVVRRALWLLAVADRGVGGCQHHALHTSIARGFQYTQSAIAGRDDEFVFVLGRCWREWRGDVEHVSAAGDRFGPAVVLHQIGGCEGELIASFDAAFAHHRAHFGFARQRAHSGAHAIAFLQKLHDAVRADEARTAR